MSSGDCEVLEALELDEDEGLGEDAGRAGAGLDDCEGALDDFAGADDLSLSGSEA